MVYVGVDEYVIVIVPVFVGETAGVNVKVCVIVTVCVMVPVCVAVNVCVIVGVNVGVMSMN